MKSEAREYDPETCVTVGELRFAGFEIPANVPDCAWTPRVAIKLDVGEVTDEGGGRFGIQVKIRSLVPFRWVEAKATFDAKGARTDD